MRLTMGAGRLIIMLIMLVSYFVAISIFLFKAKYDTSWCTSQLFLDLIDLITWFSKV
jgi:hypothetical protein